MRVDRLAYRHRGKQPWRLNSHVLDDTRAAVDPVERHHAAQSHHRKLTGFCDHVARDGNVQPRDVPGPEREPPERDPIAYPERLRISVRGLGSRDGAHGNDKRMDEPDVVQVNVETANLRRRRSDVFAERPLGTADPPRHDVNPATRPAVTFRRMTAAALGKLADLTGPNITERWGVTCTDLGASVLAPNGKLVSVFGDTFSGRRVGQGDWRSPVV